MKKYFCIGLLILAMTLMAACGKKPATAHATKPAASQETTASVSATATGASSAKNETNTSARNGSEDSSKSTVVLGAVTMGYYSDSSHQGSKVDIKYPIFEGNDEVNKLIKETAVDYINEFCGTDYVDLTADINFQVSYSSNTLVSVIFSGLVNVRTAAHPNNIFFTVNIDPQKSELVKFNDRYQMNSALINTFYRRAQEQVPSYVYSYLTQNRQEIEKDLNSIDDPSSGNYTYSYFTAKGVGISVPTIFAIGDHAEVELTYADLAQN